jgi:hypothetical protein
MFSINSIFSQFDVGFWNHMSWKMGGMPTSMINPLTTMTWIEETTNSSTIEWTLWKCFWILGRLMWAMLSWSSLSCSVGICLIPLSAPMRVPPPFLFGCRSPYMLCYGNELIFFQLSQLKICYYIMGKKCFD